MYDRWVERNAQRVAELSKGKLGYIHIPSMDEAGLDRFVRSLYSDNFDKEAIVLDVRYNGGGFTHDQVLNYLGGKEHTFFQQRDGGEGWCCAPTTASGPSRWCCSSTIAPTATPRSSRTPSARWAWASWSASRPAASSSAPAQVRLIDGSMFRMPRTGVYTTKGVNMEKEGVAPGRAGGDHPDQLAKGIDAQLDKAVEVLQGEVIVWKKKNPASVAITPGGSGPVTPVTSPVPMAPFMPSAK